MEQEQMQQAFKSFIECSDFLEGKAIVEQSAEGLLSEAGAEYLQRYLKEFGDHAEFGPVLRLKGQALSDSRRVSISYGFSRLLLAIYPQPCTDRAIAAFARGSQEEIEKLVEQQPQLVAELQQVFAAATMLEAVKADLQSANLPAADQRRIDMCDVGLQLADRRLDAYTWAAFAGELGNALTALATDDAEGAVTRAIDLYRQALEFYESEASEELASSAMFSLGNALGFRSAGDDNADLAEAAAWLERAMQFRARDERPFEWAQSMQALGRVMLKWQGTQRAERLDAAIAQFRACLDVYSLDTSPAEWISALYELGETFMARSNGSRNDNVREAIKCYRTLLLAGLAVLSEAQLIRIQTALAQAYAMLAAASDVAHGSHAESIEIAFDDREWLLSQKIEQAAFVSEDWVPADTSLELWSELITVERYTCASDMPFAGLVAARRRQLQSPLTNGSLQFELVDETERELIYRWTVTDDFAIEDQCSIVRVLRGKSALHSVHYIARGALNDDEQAMWLERLRSARVRDDAPQRQAPQRPTADQAELERRIAMLQGPPAESPAEPWNFCRSLVAGVDRSTNAELWSTLLTLAGMYLLRVSAPSDAVTDAALAALRRSLEVVSASQQPERWARIVLNVGRAWSRRRLGERAENLDRAVFAYQQAAQTFAAERQMLDLAAALRGMADVYRDRGSVDDPEQLYAAVELYEQSLKFCAADEAPAEWAETTLACGDVNLELSATEEGRPLRKKAIAAYAKVQEQFAANPNFGKLDADTIGKLMGYAIMRLNQIDREGMPEPRVPEGFFDREVSGKALYLRPLLSAGTLLIPNRCVDPALFAVQFDVEPAVVTIEAALYRALGEYLSFSGIAGRSEGLGGTRAYMAGGEDWQGLVESYFETADLVLMFPHNSAGVRWEINYLIAHEALARTVFVMPPHSDGYDVPELWASAADMMQELGLALPPYSNEGLLFCLDANAVTVTFPFSAVWDNTLFELLRPRLSRPT